MTRDKRRRMMESKLNRMFSAHGYNNRAYDDLPWIADMCIRGIFSFTSEEIEILEMPQDFGLTPIGNESAKHLNAKYTAHQYLLKDGAIKPLFEQCYWDVFSPELSTVIECGTSRPAGLIETLLAGVKNFWVLQYPGGVRKPHMLHKFSLVNGDIEGLKKYQELRDKIEVEALARKMERPVEWV